MRAPLLAISIVFLVVFIDLTNSRRIRLNRWKRTVITGSAFAQATGNVTNTGNTLMGVLTADSSKGINFTSMGKAMGQNSITVDNQVSGAVQYQNGILGSSMSAGSVGAMGANSLGESTSNGMAISPSNWVYSYQRTNDNEAGDTAAQLIGSAVVIQNGQVVSPFSNTDKETLATGASSQLGDAQMILQPNVTWEAILADLAISPVGADTGTDDANVNYIANK